MVTWVARATAKEAHCPVNAARITSSTGKRRRMYRELTQFSMAQVRCKDIKVDALSEDRRFATA
jgi:hypothetical protein